MKNLFKIIIPEKRNFGLDLLRFIAIVTVLISHSITVLPQNYYFVHKFITDGVLIFFVLSGFLIGRILIRDFKDGITWSKILNFWKRRWWRTLPAFYFTAFLLIIFSFLFQKHIEIKNIIKACLFIQNITFQRGYFFPESWSLAIEEWFYFIFPILILLLVSVKPKRSVLLAISFLLIFSLSVRLYFYFHILPQNINIWDSFFRSSVVARLDSIAIGVLGAWIYTFKNELFTKFKNLFFFVGLIIFLLNKIYFDYFLIGSDYLYISVFYFLITPLSILMVIPKIYYMKVPSSQLLANIVTKGSLISYSMYLLNLSLISYLILFNLKINMWINFIFFWILTILGSTLMYKYIELPFLKLRDKNNY